MATRKTPTRKKTTGKKAAGKKSDGGSVTKAAPSVRKAARKAVAKAPAPQAPAKRVRKPPQASQLASTTVVAPVEAAVPSPAPASSDARPHAWVAAVRGAEEKKALNIKVLDLREVTSFCDFFVIASGTNPKQVQAIAEGIDRELRTIGERANAVEGFDNAEWILADYGDFIVHVFSEKSREFYDLERLWRAAKTLVPAGEASPEA